MLLFSCPTGVPQVSPRAGTLSLLRDSCSLQAKGAGFLHGDQQLLIQHGVRGVRRQVQAVETGVSPEGDGDNC